MNTYFHLDFYGHLTKWNLFYVFQIVVHENFNNIPRFFGAENKQWL